MMSKEWPDNEEVMEKARVRGQSTAVDLHGNLTGGSPNLGAYGTSRTGQYDQRKPVTGCRSLQVSN